MSTVFGINIDLIIPYYVNPWITVKEELEDEIIEEKEDDNTECKTMNVKVLISNQ